MPTTLPKWFRGQDVYSVTVTGQIADAAGGLTAGTAQDFTVIIDDVQYNGRNQMEDIAPITSPYVNNVIVERDDSVTLIEILRRGLDKQLLALTTMVAGSDYVSVVVKHGYGANTTGTRAVATETFFGTMGPYRETLRKGKSTAQLVIMQIDLVGVGENNPAYAMTDL